MSQPVDPRGTGQPVPGAELQRLWAPWRSAYVVDAGSSPTPIDGCPFCVLPERDPTRDRESLLLHRGEHAYVICNAYPYSPGHVMVIPYRHEPDLEVLDDATAHEMWDLTRRSVAVLKDRLDCEGVNLGANLGAAAGAGIAPHLHLHAVPRWSGDTNFMTVVGATRVLPQALEDVYDRLRGAWD